jgi:hypothetical protein
MKNYNVTQDTYQTFLWIAASPFSFSKWPGRIAICAALPVRSLQRSSYLCPGEWQVEYMISVFLNVLVYNQLSTYQRVDRVTWDIPKGSNFTQYIMQGYNFTQVRLETLSCSNQICDVWEQGLRNYRTNRDSVKYLVQVRCEVTN